MLSLVPSAWAVENEESSQEAVVEEPETELIEGLQARINALPDADTLAEMDEDERAEVYAEVCDIYDAIDKLTPEEGKALDVSALEEAAAFFTQQIMPLDSEPTGAMFGDCSATEEDSVKWELTQNSDGPTYTLTISGSGKMKDFDSPTIMDDDDAVKAPWYTALTVDESTKLIPITEIKISEGVTGIGSYAFAYTAITKVEFPSTASYYGKYIFRYCSALTTVDWTNYNPAPMSDTYVPDRPEGVYVPEGMFDFCTSLKQCVVGEKTYDEGCLALPENVTGICTAAFRDTAFTKIDFSSDGLKQITAVGPYAFANTKITSVTIPGDVDFYPQKNQSANTFNKCESLTSVTFEDAVTKIPGAMFNGCTNLSSVSITKEASQISEIGANAFARCLSLTNFTFPTGLKTIGGYAFAGSGLIAVDLGAVETLADYSFFGCKNLAEVEIVGTPGLTIGSTVFGTYSGYPAAAPIKKFTLENGTLDVFTSAAVDVLEELHLGNGVTTIPACVYGKFVDVDKKTGSL